MLCECIVLAQVYNMTNQYIGYNYQLRVILIGDSTVGKTSLLHEFKQDSTGGLDYSLTLGVDYYAKVLNVGQQIIKLQVWDTAGQERFRSIVRSYFRNAVGGLLIFDTTSRSSFESLDGWLQEASVSDPSHELVFILVGNKCDLKESRQVSKAEGMSYAKQHHMAYIETSAKTGLNVTEAFDSLVRTIMTLIDSSKIQMNRVSWDGVKEGEVIPTSILTSYSESVVCEVNSSDVTTHNTDESAKDAPLKKCHC